MPLCIISLLLSLVYTSVMALKHPQSFRKVEVFQLQVLEKLVAEEQVAYHLHSN